MEVGATDGDVANVAPTTPPRPRARIHKALKQASVEKTDHAIELLGCSWSEYEAHLKTTLPDGYRDVSHPDLHVDHVRPIASFDLRDNWGSRAPTFSMREGGAAGNTEGGAAHGRSPNHENYKHSTISVVYIISSNGMSRYSTGTGLPLFVFSAVRRLSRCVSLYVIITRHD